MNKKIKGYELMKLIAEKKIKKGQKFLFTNADGVKEKIFWDGENFKYPEGEEKFVLKTVGDIEFAVGDFEILEDEEEIDIQNIEELQTFSDSTVYDYNDIDRNRKVLNMLVKAVKKLDKNKVDYIQPYKEEI